MKTSRKPQPFSAKYIMNQTFMELHVSYYNEGFNKTVEHLPAVCASLLELIAVWPKINEWLRADTDRSVMVNFAMPNGKYSAYCEIDHCTGQTVHTTPDMPFVTTFQEG